MLAPGRKNILALIFGLMVLTGCEVSEAERHSLFRLMPTEETGISFENRLLADTLFNSINYLYFYDGGGVAAGDINGDGKADIYLAANMTANHLYLNRGDFRFDDITLTAGTGGGVGGWTTGVSMVDINADGWLDIYVCRSSYLNRQGGNQLFINNGDLTFTEQAAAFGLDFQGLARQAAFFDYDGDNDLDVYLLNHSVHAKGTYRDVSLRQIRDAEAGDRLLRNDGGKFTDVSAAAGIFGSSLGYGLGVAIADLNMDGFPDIYVSNDFHEDDYLYYNNGDGTFSEGMKESMGHTSLASMGNDVADINNDGLPDIVVVDMLAEDEAVLKSSVSADAQDVYDAKSRFGYYHQVRRNTLQLNQGPLNTAPAPGARPGIFSEIGGYAGIAATDWSWAPLFFDADNDGFKDLFITNGIYHRANDLDFLDYVHQRGIDRQKVAAPGEQPPPLEMEKIREAEALMPIVPQANYFFHSRHDLTFQNRSLEWGTAGPGFSSGAAYADLDGDGALDLVVNNVNATASIYRNLLYDGRVERPGSYLKIKLRGPAGNRDGIGTRVSVHHQGKQLTHYLMPCRGFQSSVEPALTIGLGELPRIDSLRIDWPDRRWQVIRDVAVNQQLLADYKTSAPPATPAAPPHQPQLFAEIDSAEARIDYRHSENRFRQQGQDPLDPRYLSREGPALAVGDVNQDGLDDLFLGGARSQRGELFIQSRNGAFDREADFFSTNERGYEDVDACFFDANGDGRLDLYVVSGGNEYAGNSSGLRDRLFLGRGEGGFEKREDLLPDILANGSCVAPADIDGDGDMDLFVGSRSVPREYGEIPQNYILINDGSGRFVEAVGDGFSIPGMVTDALWTDFDGDGDADLVVVGEWMPVSLFENRRGKLHNVTDDYRLSATSGWWNTIAAADINNDGRMDLIGGNLGLNSIFGDAAGGPVTMLYGDLGGNGRPYPLICTYKNGELYPLATSAQIRYHFPLIQKKYPAHKDYAGRTVRELFGRAAIADAEQYSAAELASLVFINQGEFFVWQRLPAEAQFFPVQAILSGDFNTDGDLDLLLGGNYFDVPPQQGRYDAGFGQVLLGNGQAEFTALSHHVSGVMIPGEIRRIALLNSASAGQRIIVARNDDMPVLLKKNTSVP